MEKFENKTEEKVTPETKKVSNGDTKEIAENAIAGGVESLTQSELAELKALKEKQKELKKKGIMEKIANSFKTKEELKMQENAEQVADKYLFNNKNERDFIAKKVGNLIISMTNKGFITAPTQEDITNVLNEAKTDKFEGSVGYNKDTKKITYRNSKNIKYGSALSGAPSL